MLLAVVKDVFGHNSHDPPFASNSFGRSKLISFNNKILVLMDGQGVLNLRHLEGGYTQVLCLSAIGC